MIPPALLTLEEYEAEIGAQVLVDFLPSYAELVTGQRAPEVTTVTETIRVTEEP